ncbi:MAG: 1,4-dihydroxy-6-naphthoate synthase [Desulfobulbales bacterium]|nr:1,4-dihydroxy-6-naphthoate synthase [Desulfobulbales bacterium]
MCTDVHEQADNTADSLPCDRLLTLGFSPCPNDTFIFHALVHGLAAESGLDLAPPVLADVETLNEWAMQGRLDVTKLSFHALGHVLDQYVLLNSGAALGRGCGPLLIAAKEHDRSRYRDLRIAIPGRFTTAAMLLRMFEPGCRPLVTMRFDEIMPAIAAGEVDAGVIIHESRFTYREKGFVVLRDLGTWWEENSGCPLPLGGIAARRSLGNELIAGIENGIRESVRRGFENRRLSEEYIFSHAQEIDAQVVRSHIDLYVNDFSVEMGREGRQAVETFLARGRQAGILPVSAAAPFFEKLR